MGLEATNGTADGQFESKDSPVENLREYKVICIGAGFSGICAAIRIPERLRNVELVIYEKNNGVGGTWLENTYPSCACNIPAHSYQYSFELNPHWSTFYAPSAEIRQYLEDVAQKYSVMRFVKLSHKVTSCTWDAAAREWKVNIEDMTTCRSFEDRSNVILSARGALNEKLWPDVDGLRSFQGKLLHSSAWDHTFRSRPGENENDSNSYREFRKAVEADGNSVHALTLRGSDFQNGAKAFFEDVMRKRLAKKPEIASSLVPGFAAGCRRLTPGPGYLDALVEDNVNFMSTPIAKVLSNGIELSDGKQVELDVLVCATGFNSTGPPPFPIEGIDGVTIASRYYPYPETYLGIVMDKFPNLFMMLGPNAAIGTGSLTMMMERQGDYIIKCIRKMQKEDISSMAVKPARVKDFSEYINAYFKKTVYLDDCKSWYRNEGGRGSRVVGLWPGSTLHAIEALRSPRWEDYEYEYEYSNPLRWLGNGWSSLQLEGGDVAYYLEPEFMDIPSAPLPEKTPRYEVLPFSN